MTNNIQKPAKVKVGFKKAFWMILNYSKHKIIEQIKSVSIIVLYLIIFQLFILGIPISNALVIAIGITLVIIGLAFFMDGLTLGLMPLGENCGIKLPQKAKLPVILVFSFILGMGATFAEPAIGVLKTAGSTIKAWNAPLLFLVLNKYSGYLVISVGVGVGIAVVFGMLRFIFNWSLKPFIYILVSILSVITIWGLFNPNIMYISGLAWDCGGVTTGPVTVPLVLALGIGLSRVVSGDNSDAGAGFGVVTLASAFPIITVFLLGIIFMNSVPSPMNENDFFNIQNREKVINLFLNEDELIGYALLNANQNSINTLFNNNEESYNQYLISLIDNDNKRINAFKSDKDFYNYITKLNDSDLKKYILNNNKFKEKFSSYINDSTSNQFDIFDLFKRNILGALQAILPLSLFLVIVLLFILRERIPKVDEILLGLFFAIVGMTLFSIGIELGLSKLGNQSGSNLPSSFKAIEMPDQKVIMKDFKLDYVQTAVTISGEKENFFYTKIKDTYKQLKFDKNYYNESKEEYTFIPKIGPLYGKVLGIIVVLLFAFFMGYGATLAEPALNALGSTVEELTVGTFKKSLLMQAVAIGVGIGISVGVAKIIWNIPLMWLLVPPYILLIFITWASKEDYVNIGWDSAGVTTGPITVPLVLAMGLGIGNQVGVIEGFGILSTASVFPILSVLSVGLYVNYRRNKILKES